MSLSSVFIGEGYASSPGQFLQIMQQWIYQNRSSDLMAFFEELEGHTASDQAEMLVEWMDENATKGQRDSCIQFLMDEVGKCQDDESDISPDDDSNPMN